MKYHALVFVASASVTATLAQTPPAAAVDSAVARHSCVKPRIPSASAGVNDSQMAVFVSSLNKFKECAESFAQVQQKEAERVQKAAQATAEALIGSGNAAIKDYNDFIEEAGKVMAARNAAPK